MLGHWVIQPNPNWPIIQFCLTFAWIIISKQSGLALLAPACRSDYNTNHDYSALIRLPRLSIHRPPPHRPRDTKSTLTVDVHLAVLMFTVLTSPSGLVITSWTTARSHGLTWEYTMEVVATLPVSDVRCLVSLLYRVCDVGKYSRTHSRQNILAKYFFVGVHEYKLWKDLGAREIIIGTECQ